jgi:hypothetical protein
MGKKGNVLKRKRQAGPAAVAADPTVKQLTAWARKKGNALIRENKITGQQLKCAPPPPSSSLRHHQPLPAPPAPQPFLLCARPLPCAPVLLLDTNPRAPVCCACCREAETRLPEIITKVMSTISNPDEWNATLWRLALGPAVAASGAATTGAPDSERGRGRPQAAAAVTATATASVAGRRSPRLGSSQGKRTAEEAAAAVAVAAAVAAAAVAEGAGENTKRTSKRIRHGPVHFATERFPSSHDPTAGGTLDGPTTGGAGAQASGQEGEHPPEGEGEQPPEGEEQPPEGEEQPPEGEGEQPPEGEEQPPEGEEQPPEGEEATNIPVGGGTQLARYFATNIFGAPIHLCFTYAWRRC